MAGLRPAPLRPLGVGEILDGAVRLVQRNIRSVLVVSVPYAIVAALAIALLQYVTLNSPDAATFAGAGALLVPVGPGTVLTGLLAPLYSSDLLGHPMTGSESVRRVGGRVAPLIALGLLLVVCEGVGLAACVVGGVWLWGIWAVAGPAFALERVGIRAALARSRALVNGTFWRVWGIRALGWLLVYVLTQLITLPFQLVGFAVAGVNLFDTNQQSSNAALFVAILAAGQLIAAALLGPVTSAVDLLLYTDLRMRKEGMDIVLAMPAESEFVAARPESAW